MKVSPIFGWLVLGCAKIIYRSEVSYQYIY